MQSQLSIISVKQYMNNDKNIVVRASCPHKVYLIQAELAVTRNKIMYT